MVYVIKSLWISEHALHEQMDCGSLVSITWSGIGNGIGVAGAWELLVRWWYMLWDRVGLSVVGWGGARGGTRHTWHKPIPIIINHKFTRPSSISIRWETSRSAKLDSQFLRNLIFKPLTKVASTHPSINYFQIFWCHMIDETFSHPYIWKIPQNVSHFSFGRLFKSVKFFETLGIHTKKSL